MQNKKKCNSGCGANSVLNDRGCGCHDHKKHDHCEYEPCQLEVEETETCFKNDCKLGCCQPLNIGGIQATDPIAIEARRVFDTMRFRAMADATAPCGDPLNFEIEVVEVKGPVPQGGPVNVTINEICVNYDSIVVDPGCLSLEDYDIEPRDCSNEGDTTFEYDCQGKGNRTCCEKGKGTSVVYKERGLRVEVYGLVLELKGRCGCTTFTALAYPTDCTSNSIIPYVQFVFNTLSAPICCPSSRTEILLRQSYNTSISVDCIGKCTLKYISGDRGGCGCDCDCDSGCGFDHHHPEPPCDCYFELCIPNDIDLVLAVEEVVSTLVNEQVVVLGSRTPLEPRLVDSFKYDFHSCGKR
ncbi:MAG: hypothetical protein LBN09_02215 [Clostridioides sp.]|jgi:hypothetical protein|nr:hypothetical protein [Clostridioides sp.]